MTWASPDDLIYPCPKTRLEASFLNIAARPDTPGRARSKRISEPETATDDSTGSISDTNGKSPSETLEQKVERVRMERARTARLLQQAEEDLSTATQRLEDADAVRRHLLENVASGGDEARRQRWSRRPEEGDRSREAKHMAQHDEAGIGERRPVELDRHEVEVVLRQRRAAEAADQAPPS